MIDITLRGICGYDYTADTVREAIRNKKTEKLSVHIDSYGGSVFAALEIYNELEKYEGEVTAVLEPFAMSAAAYIALAADKIVGYKNSVFMQHHAWTEVCGDASELKREAELLEKLDNLTLDAMCARAKKEKAEVEKLIANDWWIVGAEDLIDNGVIDEVINADSETGNKKEDVSQKISTAGYNMLITENIFGRNKTEAEMNLAEFLKTNPEAQAEYDKSLSDARAEGQKMSEDKAGQQMSEDRKRIADILQLSGAKLSEETMKAIQENTSAGDYAMQELQKQRDARLTAQPEPFRKLQVAQTPAQQAPEENPGMDAEAFRKLIKQEMK